MNIFLLVLTCFMMIYNHAHSQEKLTVHVLYESLCSDSIKFIKEQLYPVWNELAPYINIIFVPFGKSTSLENGATFNCQHGPKECTGNRIQSCVLNAVHDQNAQVEYVNCFMSLFKKNTHGREYGQSCAANVGVDWNYVTQCHDSSLGINLQLEAEQLTAQISPKFVPTILFNGQFHQQAQDDSQQNFRGVLCALIIQTYPQACQSPKVLQI